MNLLGPFSQIITLQDLPTSGPITDAALKIISHGGVVIDGESIFAVGPFDDLRKQPGLKVHEIPNAPCLLPGFIDTHTHICFAGSRARDYALRVAGVSYQEIARQGGGILDTVTQTRNASKEDLTQALTERAALQLLNGVTTCEVKSGYGLNIDDELKMLEVIQRVSKSQPLDLVATCLAAHVCPQEFANPPSYLEAIAKELLPLIVQNKLSRRVDIYVDNGAFSADEARPYIRAAQGLGFKIVVHADQFATGGSALACEVGALSADHLEASTDREITALAKAGVIATVLPGASLGLGMPFAPARKLLDQGCAVVIASDWNPGSAPMGDLLTQAAVLGAAQRLSMTETLAGMTIRAACALELPDRGALKKGMLADMQAFPCKDYREILYHQGQLKPTTVWKRGAVCRFN